jgi:hypothetical protein
MLFLGNICLDVFIPRGQNFKNVAHLFFHLYFRGKGAIIKHKPKEKEIMFFLKKVRKKLETQQVQFDTATLWWFFLSSTLLPHYPWNKLAIIT